MENNEIKEVKEVKEKKADKNSDLIKNAAFGAIIAFFFYRLGKKNTVNEFKRELRKIDFGKDCPFTLLYLKKQEFLVHKWLMAVDHDLTEYENIKKIGLDKLKEIVK